MFGLKHQRHTPAFHFGVAFDFAYRPQLIFDLLKQIAAQFQVSHFTPLKLERELNLIALFEELARMIDLDHQIMIADADSLQLQFLELAAAAGSAGLVFLLLLLIAPLAVIHDSADGRASGGSNFDKIHPSFACHAQGFGGGNGSDFFIQGVDQKDW